MFNFIGKSDSSLQHDVETELKWDPSVTEDQIRVTANNGVISLRGNVPHYSEKMSAEKAALRVGGVRVVADELEINILGNFQRSDEDIASTALSALEWNYQVPETVKLTVDKGWITLRGEVEWDYQRKAARDAVYLLMGVCGVSNDILIKSNLKIADVKTRIEEALKRSADKESDQIKVAVNGSTVSLSGNVNSLMDKEEAGLAAYNAPGVMWVENKLKLVA